MVRRRQLPRCRAPLRQRIRGLSWVPALGLGLITRLNSLILLPRHRLIQATSLLVPTLRRGCRTSLLHQRRPGSSLRATGRVPRRRQTRSMRRRRPARRHHTWTRKSRLSLTFHRCRISHASSTDTTTTTTGIRIHRRYCSPMPWDRQPLPRGRPQCRASWATALRHLRAIAPDQSRNLGTHHLLLLRHGTEVWRPQGGITMRRHIASPASAARLLWGLVPVSPASTRRRRAGFWATCSRGERGPAPLEPLRILTLHLRLVQRH